MKIIKISSLEDAAKFTLKKVELVTNKHSPFYLVLTGGRYGNYLLNYFLKNEVDISGWKIFLTDERLNCRNEDINAIQLLKKLKILKGFNKNNIHFFYSGSQNPELSIKPVSKEIDMIENKKFNICLLSLGEDGHLAGHFNSSVLMKDNRFVYTKEAPKPNNFRVSFRISWLTESDLIILCIKGESKRKAYSELIQKRGTHSELIEKEKLVIMSDLTV